MATPECVKACVVCGNRRAAASMSDHINDGARLFVCGEKEGQVANLMCASDEMLALFETHGNNSGLGRILDRHYWPSDLTVGLWVNVGLVEVVVTDSPSNDVLLSKVHPPSLFGAEE